MIIKMYENKAEKNFSFKVFWKKKAILIGQKFPSRTECLSHIERTLSALKTNNMINVRSEGTNGYAFTVTKTESVLFKSLDLASDGLAYLKEVVGKTDEFKVSFDTLKKKNIAKKIMLHKEARYDLKEASKTKKPGFELIDKAKTNFFYFHFNDAKGRPFLYSRAYDGKNRRTKAAKRLIKGVKAKEIVTDIRAVKEGVMLVIKDKDGLEVTRSRTYKKRSSLDKAFAFFKKEAVGKVEILKVPKKKKKKKGKNKKTLKLPKETYLLNQVAPIAEVGFEGFKSVENKLHYFHYQDKKGKTLLYGPAFTARKTREEAIQQVIQFSKDKRNYAMKEKGRKHHFTLLNAEKKELARSRFFASQKEMIEGMRHFHSNARAYGESESVVTVPTTEIISIVLGKNSKPTNNLKKKQVVASNTKSDVAIAPLNGVKDRKPKVLTKDTALPKERVQNNGIAKNAQPISKETKIAPTKEKTVVVEKTKKPLASKPNALKATPKKPIVPRNTPPLKKVDKTPRVSTKTKTNPLPINKERRNVTDPKKVTTSPKPIPPRIQPRADSADQSVVNWWWVPVFLVAGLLLYALFKLLSGFGFLGQEQSVLPIEPAKKEIVQAVEKLPTLLGPSSTELGFVKGSLSAKIADFLSLPESVFPKTFLLDKVHFPFNKEILTGDAQGQLSRIAQILTTYPKSYIQINGHTDSVGDADRNLTLSERRAIIVKDYLSSKGIAATRIVTKGFGITRPIKSNDTEEGKQANRRSEIVLLRRE